MESVEVCEPSPLIGELMQGRELTMKLMVQLNESGSTEPCKYLVQSIIESLEKAMSVARTSTTLHQEQRAANSVAGLGSPGSVDSIPTMGSVSEQHTLKKNREMHKKRKALEKWTRRVKVCTTTGLEGPPDDGFGWRKYGQKDILGFKHPRGYYRCTHRPTQGCLATKQVQRSNEDPAVFEITYRGQHSCIQKTSQNQNGVHGNSDHQISPRLETGPKIETETDTQKFASPSFFPFAPAPTSNIKTDSHNHIFSSPSTPYDQFMATNVISSFISPANSESDYMPFTPCFGNPTELFSPGTSMHEVDLDNFDPSLVFEASFFS